MLATTPGSATVQGAHVGPKGVSPTIIDSYQASEKAHGEAEAAQSQLGGTFGSIISDMLKAASWTLATPDTPINELHTDRKHVTVTVHEPKDTIDAKSN